MTYMLEGHLSFKWALCLVTVNIPGDPDYTITVPSQDRTRSRYAMN